jgi:tetratricopeptide (TPR) repeat protein
MRYRLLALTLLLVACSKRAVPDACADAEGGRPIGPALLAFLSRARAAHHRADAFEEQNDLAHAETELDAILKGPKPPCPSAAEVREVLADTHARLADMGSQRGEFGAALEGVARGLALVPEQSYFRGHLLEVRGLVEERHAKALAKAGDAAGARAAMERAMAAFQDAMRIQSAVIERATPER